MLVSSIGWLVPWTDEEAVGRPVACRAFCGLLLVGVWGVVWAGPCVWPVMLSVSSLGALWGCCLGAALSRPFVRPSWAPSFLDGLCHLHVLTCHVSDALGVKHSVARSGLTLTSTCLGYD